MVIHWGTLTKNLARFSADTVDFLGDQNHTLGQLHKQKTSQDIHHPSSLNFEWGRAFFFFLFSLKFQHLWDVQMSRDRLMKYWNIYDIMNMSDKPAEAALNKGEKMLTRLI